MNNFIKFQLNNFYLFAKLKLNLKLNLCTTWLCHCGINKWGLLRCNQKT